VVNIDAGGGILGVRHELYILYTCGLNRVQDVYMVCSFLGVVPTNARRSTRTAYNIHMRDKYFSRLELVLRINTLLTLLASPTLCRYSNKIPTF